MQENLCRTGRISLENIHNCVEGCLEGAYLCEKNLEMLKLYVKNSLFLKLYRKTFRLVVEYSTKKQDGTPGWQMIF